MISPVFLAIGLVRPETYSKIFNQKLSRIKIFLTTLAIATLSIVGFGVTTDISPGTTMKSETKEQEQVLEEGTKEEPKIEEEYKEDKEESAQEVAGEKSETVKVTRVIDGDTIEIEGGKRVRYIGMNTPESGQCFGREASNKNKELVLSKQVRLEKDISETDRYGRLLRYVWIGDSLLNEVLVRQGFAQVSTYPPDVKYEDRFLEAQRLARNEGLGLWSGICEEKTKTPSPTSSTGSTGACKYSCSGPDRDCSDFSTQSEAQAFFSCCGFTATYDPMKLDGWGNKIDDGIPCESLP